MPEVILNQLYKLTQLQTSYGINSLVIDKGVPKVMSIKDMLNAYLDHQEEVITRRSNYLLKQYRDRIHVLQGLKVACDNIDEVISIIRASKSAAIASESLMERFELTQIQAKAILDMQLHRLTGLELEGINNDIEKLQANIDELEGIISDRTKLVALLKEELEEVRKYSDERRTEITNDFSDIDDEDLMCILRDKNIYLEMCYSSNLQTKTVNMAEDYPIVEFLKNDIGVTLNTDNITVSNTTLKNEYLLVQKQFSLDENTLLNIVLNSVKATFLSEDRKEQLKDQIIREFSEWLNKIDK